MSFEVLTRAVVIVRLLLDGFGRPRPPSSLDSGQHRERQHANIDTAVLFRVLFEVLLKGGVGASTGSLLQEAQLTGTGDRFGAALDAELAEDPPVVSLDRVQGEEESLADPAVRESFGDEQQHFALTLAQ